MIRHISTAAAMTALLLTTMAAPVQAQAQGVRVTISYNMSVNAKSDAAEDIAEAQMSARRALYTMMAKECEVLRETIAESCDLTNFTIQSGSRYRRRNENPNAVSVRGSGTYRIRLK